MRTAQARILKSATIEGPREPATVSPLTTEEDPPTVSEVALSSGRAIRIEEGTIDRITVHNPEGLVELSIRFTAEGPVLTVASAALELQATRDLNIDCKRLRVHASAGIEVRTEGDITEVAGGLARCEAHRVEIQARRGDVAIRANDDARIDGERILLNS